MQVLGILQDASLVGSGRIWYGESDVENNSMLRIGSEHLGEDAVR